MSKLGYYRYKLGNLANGGTNAPFVTHKAIAREAGTGWRQLKWIDGNGQLN